MLYYDELFSKSQCLNCRQEIPGLGIECAECSGGNFRVCCDCFAVGAEIGQHRKEHRYRFFDSGSLSLFPASASEVASTKENNGNSGTSARWSAREEIRLLDAIEQYGFGNWQDISKHIESRGATEAKDEFVQRYVTGNIGQVSWAERNNNGGIGGGNEYEFKRDIDVFPQPIDHTIPVDEGPLSPSLTQRLPPLDISSDEMLQLGYMPFRDDYEKEYDNDAEKLVSQLSFTPEDDEVDVGLKLALVDMYSRRLRERARRKRVIRDYQLVCKFFKKDRAKAIATANGDSSTETKETSKRFQSYEKQLQETFHPFAQFYNGREFDNMVRNLVKEKDLVLRLQELYKYRAAGITRAEECVEFERTKTAASLRAKRGAGALGTLDEEDEEDRSHKKAMIQSPVLIQQLLQANLTGSPKTMGPGNEGSVGGDVYVDRNPTLQQFSKGDFSLKSSELNVSEPALLPQILQGVGMDQTPLPQQGPLEEDLFQLNGRPKAWEGQYTVNCIPGADLLTEEELDLCKKVYLLPDQFLTVKLAFVLGRLKLDGTSDPCDENVYVCPPEIDSNEWNQLLAFFKSQSLNQSPVQVHLL